MSVSEFLEKLESESHFRERIVYAKTIEAKDAIWGSPKHKLSKKTIEFLDSQGTTLYEHQCEAIDGVMEDENVIVTTPTASGKTLAFNIPVFEALMPDKKATALYIYPAKALANDQLQKAADMDRFLSAGARPAIYDGDTPSDRRKGIRENSRIILTNPYELHLTLNWHGRWKKFLKNVRFVVIDEAHRYRGVFGSNVALLMRRLRRIMGLYGSHPIFILSSATLANPVEFAQKLTGLDFKLVDRDTSPGGKKVFALYNPYFDLIGERSAFQETKNLFVESVKSGTQTLCFTKTRMTAELIITRSKEDKELPREFEKKVAVYRAGYLPEERRAVERGLKEGRLAGVASTNALELGMDIGSLDAVLICGYPGTMVSTWQQAGRAGRGADDSVVVLIAFFNPVNQFFMNNPAEFFGRPHEHAIVDLENPYILAGHTLCAAAEAPIDIEMDAAYLGEKLPRISEALIAEGIMQETSFGLIYSGTGVPSQEVALDSISSEKYKLMAGENVLETLDRGQACREAHPGAVKLHQGETYTVNEIDFENMVIPAERMDVDYYTIPMSSVNIEILAEKEGKKYGGLNAYVGDVKVVEDYFAYKVMRYDRLLDQRPLDLPTITLETVSLWINLTDEIAGNIESSEFSGGVHGAEHALISVAPLLLMCDQRDISGVSECPHGQTKANTIFIYDGFEGGIGLSEKLFSLLPKALQMAYELVGGCGCDEGCPGCIQLANCRTQNQNLSKNGAKMILEMLVEATDR